jgi:hypothetical protein
MRRKHDKSREEQLASEVLEIVERFHEPSNNRHAEPRRVMRLAVPAAFEALALVSLAHQVRSRRNRSDRMHTPAANLRDGMRRAFVLRHL